MENSKQNERYQLISGKARMLFWRHGIRRVTVEEICKEAGVSKMTFYRFFKNKKELAEIVLSEIQEEGLKKYRSIMQQEISFAEKMKLIIVLKRDASSEISEEFIKDIYQNNESDLKRKIEEFTHQMRIEILNDFKTAQQNGWIRKDIKLEFIMYMQEQLTQLIFDPNLKHMYKNSQDLIMEVTNFFFYGILHKED